MAPWAPSSPMGGFAQKPHDFSRGGVFTSDAGPRVEPTLAATASTTQRPGGGSLEPKKIKRMERRSHAHAMDESPVWRISHGQATCQRRTLATHRTALASTQASSLPVPRDKPLDYRKVLTGIIFVLKTGSPGRSCTRRWAVAVA